MFSNIAKSEQRHVDSVLYLLGKGDGPRRLNSLKK
ncbi:MAG: hypothetical protein AB1Z28_00395 [Desulfobacterales bacterium]